MSKKIYTILAIAAFGLGMQTATQAQTCTAVDAITTSTLTLTNQSKVCETTAALKFTCNKTNGSRQFTYGKTTSYGTSGGNATGSRTPSISLNGLEPGTKYYFKIDAVYEGSTKYTMTGSFTTNTAGAANTPPVLTALPDSMVVKVDSTATFTVKATDADKNPLQFTYPGIPSWVTTKDSVVTFKPVSGSKSFIFKVSVADGKGGTAQDSMKISVLEPKVGIRPMAVASAVPNTIITIGKNMVAIPSGSDKTLSVQLFSINGALVFKHDVNVINQMGTVPVGLLRGNGTYLCKITGTTTSQKQVVTILN